MPNQNQPTSVQPSAGGQIQELTVRQAFYMAGFPVVAEARIWATYTDDKWSWVAYEPGGHGHELWFDDEPHYLANRVGWNGYGDFATTKIFPDLSDLPISACFEALPKLVQAKLAVPTPSDSDQTGEAGSGCQTEGEKP